MTVYELLEVTTLFMEASITISYKDKPSQTLETAAAVELITAYDAEYLKGLNVNLIYVEKGKLFIICTG